MKRKSSKSKSNAKSKKSNASGKNAKSKAGQKSGSESGDIASLILKDHKPIKELILILKDPDVSISEKQTAYAEFEPTLSCHARAEEESLYVYLKQEDDLRIEGLEGDTEHAIADQLMNEINESEGDDDTWMAKVKVLAEIVDHHVKEEEKDVLKEVRKDFSSEERKEIGKVYSRLLNQYRKVNGKQEYFLESARP